jgi:hypothetical protein
MRSGTAVPQVTAVPECRALFNDRLSKHERSKQRASTSVATQARRSQAGWTRNRSANAEDFETGLLD